jgi:hypothetical protein
MNGGFFRTPGFSESAGADVEASGYLDTYLGISIGGWIYRTSWDRDIVI